MALNIASYNLHGYNQGYPLLISLCESFDVILLQEHWLYPNELALLDDINRDFMCISVSSMGKLLSSGVRHGRPFGGVGILVHKKLLSKFKCVARRERFIAVFIGNVLLLNVYLPVNTGTVDYSEEMRCVLEDMMSVIRDCQATDVIVAGDFNFNFELDVKVRNMFQVATGDSLVTCDDLLELDDCSLAHPVTFRRNAEHCGTFIDHFCVTRNLKHAVVRSYIIDSGANLSDHLPICIEINCDSAISLNGRREIEHRRRFRWDKADVLSYYHSTYSLLSQIPVSDELLDCLKMRSGNAQYCVDYVYNSLVNALSASAEAWVPRTKSGFYKVWWNDTLTELKRASIEAHDLWKLCGCPKNGDVFMSMKRAKIAYKQAIKMNRVDEESYFSNELNDLLLSKDVPGFWRSWNAKIGGVKTSPVIDGVTDSSLIAQKFADLFQTNCCQAQVDNCNADAFLQHLRLLKTSDVSGLKLLDVETVSRCLARMKKCKAPGIDNIETEHLVYAHPLLVVQLCVLFNTMMQCSVVPETFHAGIVVPVLKDKRGDVTDMNNYRAVTLSSCISKLFEMCLLELYGDMLSTSPLQFGFKKKLGTRHALYVLRSTVEYFVKNGSTVNVALLDISKAFDNVHHIQLFKKLLELGLPPGIVELLAVWYDGSYACVRWHMCMSACFSLTVGVRQGGVLSPVLFTVYVNSILLRLQQSNYGCVIASQFLGCIMYADDLVLLCPSICGLKKMLDICVDEVTGLNLKLNVKKSCILRFGSRYMHNCKEVAFDGGVIEFVTKAKYLGVMLKVGKNFGVDVQYMKSNFYSSFNSVFHRVAKFQNELVVLQLVTTFCQPYLLYCVECLELSVTQLRSIEHTWLCAISHIFHITGSHVKLVSDFAGKIPFSDMLQDRRKQFLDGLRFVDNSVLQFMSVLV